MARWEMDNLVTARNNVVVKGKGRQPMVFAHGFGCDQNMWRFVTPQFEEDYKVVLFDHVGCGRSDLSAYQVERYRTLEGYARDILEIIEALGLRDVILVAHSVSAMMGILIAKLAPERFAHLVLIVPSACYIDHPPGYFGGFSRADLEGLLDLMEKNFVGWATFLAPVVFKNDDQPDLQKELVASFCAADPSIARRFAAVTFLSDHRADVAGVTTPTLILQCEDDSVAPAAAIEFIHKQIPGSHLHRLRATGHCPHMSHPAETSAAIIQYLDTHARSPR